MNTHKPGRALFWFSLACVVWGWIIAVAETRGLLPRDCALLALALWIAGAAAGVMWVIVKVWQLLCRVRISEENRPPRHYLLDAADDTGPMPPR